jgi:hypothetical protein
MVPSVGFGVGDVEKGAFERGTHCVLILCGVEQVELWGLQYACAFCLNVRVATA